MSSKVELEKLNVYIHYKGCEKCPFRKLDGSLCDRDKNTSIIVKMHRDSFENGDPKGRRLWRRGEKIRALGVVLGGIVFCARAESTTVRPKITEYIWLQRDLLSVYLSNDDHTKPKLSVKERKNRQALKKWQRQQNQNRNSNFNV